MRSGPPSQAREALDVAVSEREGPWALFLRALLRSSIGDASGARRDASAFRRAGPRGPALGLEAYLHAAGGRWPRARAALARAAALAPRRAWPHDWAAALLLARNDHAGARESLLKAARLEPSSRRKAALAEVCEQLGYLREAGRWAAAACAAAPSAANHAMVALLWDRRRQYDRSARAYKLALKLAPGDDGLRLSLSQALALHGRLDAARAEAARTSPANGAALLWRAQLEGLAKGPAAAARAAAGAPPAIRAFARGYAELSRGRFPAAAGSFARAAALDAGGSFTRKARFYRTASLMLGAPRSGSVPSLCLAGLGVDPPYSASVEALNALSRCDVLFNNVSGTETAEVLWPLCRDVRPVFSEDDRLDSLASRILRELRAGRRVGFVTRGGALVFGELGEILARRCRDEGLSWSSLPALSSPDLFEARFGRGKESGAGILSGFAETAGRRLDPGVPWTVFLPNGLPKAGYRALCRDLAANLGPARPALVFDHKVGQEPLVARVDGLAAMHARLSPAAIVRTAGPGGFRATGAPAEGALTLVGLGPRPAAHATLAALETLGRASYILSEGLDMGSLRFVARFAAAGLARVEDGPERGLRGVRLALEHGRSAVYVTAFHPFRFSVRVEPLLRLCAARGWTAGVLPAISAENAAAAIAGLPLGTGIRALQSFEASAVRAGLVREDPEWPAVIYSPPSPELALRVPGSLRRRVLQTTDLKPNRPAGTEARGPRSSRPARAPRA